ncbi:unnamed protein product [Trichogramma brassicae]|uniref:Uncharacterized protein n=1 Tax=Trichogramma brassicae TaxID=86971 RepID=A0A6H5JAG4_9HYME|nr:unnamed protein product [Trichogramma brassicae]
MVIFHRNARIEKTKDGGAKNDSKFIEMAASQRRRRRRSASGSGSGSGERASRQAMFGQSSFNKADTSYSQSDSDSDRRMDDSDKKMDDSENSGRQSHTEYDIYDFPGSLKYVNSGCVSEEFMQPKTAQYILFVILNRYLYYETNGAVTVHNHTVRTPLWHIRDCLRTERVPRPRRKNNNYCLYGTIRNRVSKRYRIKFTQNVYVLHINCCCAQQSSHLFSPTCVCGYSRAYARAIPERRSSQAVTRRSPCCASGLCTRLRHGCAAVFARDCAHAARRACARMRAGLRPAARRAVRAAARRTVSRGCALRLRAGLCRAASAELCARAARRTVRAASCGARTANARWGVRAELPGLCALIMCARLVRAEARGG